MGRAQDRMKKRVDDNATSTKQDGRQERRTDDSNHGVLAMPGGGRLDAVNVDVSGVAEDRLNTCGGVVEHCGDVRNTSATCTGDVGNQVAARIDFEGSVKAADHVRVEFAPRQSVEKSLPS